MTDTSDIPKWDLTQLAMRTWINDLQRHLRKKKDFVTLVTKGIVLDSRYNTIVPTEFHGCALRDDLVRDCSFDQPISDEIFNDYAIPTGMAPLTKAEDVKVYREAIRQVDRQLATDILECIASEGERKHWEALSGGSGLALLHPSYMTRPTNPATPPISPSN